jgi:glutamate racemase
MFILLFVIGCSKDPNLSEEEKLRQFFAKDSVDIVITDSGLGGLSVFADLIERITDAGIFRSVRITYFNAQLDSSTGYNDLKNNDQKIKIFDNALEAMQKNFRPDMILIACNTLSVIYPQTTACKEFEIPVIGIVETGVDLILDRLHADDSSTVVIFATRTTVEQNSHRRMLEQAGVPPDRLVAQACPELAGAIERSATGEKTRNLVKEYIEEALMKLADPEAPLIISFNCTHYGYVRDIFEGHLLARGKTVSDILDPNTQMIDFLFTAPYLNRYPETVLKYQVVSQPELSETRINSIGSLIAKTSARSYEALKNYTFKPNFFEWQSIARE